MFRKIGIFSSEDKSLSWWWLGIKVGVVTALIIWWWWENQKEKKMRGIADKTVREDVRSIPLPAEDSPLVETVEAETVKVPATEPDDLTKIEGIGPKINATLQEAGITTYLQLAASKPDAIKQVLLDAGVRIGFPETWPEQAALAAKADWDALKELQRGLQGGRRVG